MHDLLRDSWLLAPIQSVGFDRLFVFVCGCQQRGKSEELFIQSKRSQVTFQAGLILLNFIFEQPTVHSCNE